MEKKKDEIRSMYQDSLEENLKVINNLKIVVKQKIAVLGGVPPADGFLSGQGMPMTQPMDQRSGQNVTDRKQHPI